MNAKPTGPTGPHIPTLSLGDIYYILFRHKWKIAIISVAGFLMSLALPAVTPKVYQSEAKLLIRYVLETRAPAQPGSGDPRVTTPGDAGGNILNTEMQILTSLDLAQEVATNIGPEKILGKGGTDVYTAAAVIRGGLFVEVPAKSDVLRIVFKHSDPAMVQPILSQVIRTYLDRHAEIHRARFDDFLTQETDQLRSRLARTEEALRTAKTNLNIVSLDDSRKMFGDQMARIQQSIFDAEAELAEHKATVEELSIVNHAKPAATNTTDTQAATPASPDQTAEYRRISSLLNGLQKKEEDLLVQGFLPGSSRVKDVQQQIASTEKAKKQMEAENPGLLAVTVSSPKNNDTTPAWQLNSAAENTRIAALESKIRVLTNQLALIKEHASAVDASEGSITELERTRKLEEAHYTYFSANLEQSRIDEALGPGKVSNISTIQSPSPPFRDTTKMRKLMTMLALGGVAAALALAFLIELYLDRSFKRPREIETALGVPLFLSIPYRNGNGNGARRLLNWPAKTDAAEVTTDVAVAEKSATAVAPWDAGHVLHPFYDALRDRLITDFEIKNLTHKPKLVAVTSCSEGAGVSTIASGLAAALSETGDGNVLLVDMNSQQGAAHYFHKGSLACDLDDALTLEKRHEARVQDNLYAVSETLNGDILPRVLPKRFTHLVPKLKGSDYDYIIFDLPPVSQISITPRLARFMDIMLVVIESEKTDRAVVQRAVSVLTEARANVGVVLNKRKDYVPRRIQGEL